jgi:DNA-binding response OmpR family regulator
VGRVLVLEPNEEIRELLARVLVRLGHEVVAPGYVPERPPNVDAVILEPTWPQALELAKALRGADGRMPIVFASLEPWGVDSTGIRPVRRLLKPFGLRDLEAAIRAVLPER